MKLAAACYRLPLGFDAAQLQKEALQFAESAWRPNRDRMEGNSVLALLQAGESDVVRGPMLPTSQLQCCPYVRQVLAAFETVIGRTRLMRLDAGAEIAPHFDSNYYWRDRVRVHIPITSDPAVRFHCGDQEVYMAPGEAWIIDNWRVHSVINGSAVRRIHLVFDTVGSAAFWDLVERGAQPYGPATRELAVPRFFPFDPQADTVFPIEQHNLPAVMPPAELTAVIGEALDDAAHGMHEPDHAEVLSRVARSTTRCLREWRATWAVHGERPEGWPRFHALQQQLLEGLVELPDELRVASNGRKLAQVLVPLYRAAFNPGFAMESPRQRTSSLPA